MKTKVAAPLFLTLFVCLSASAASPEEEYLAARNGFIEKFEEAKEREALAQLEKQMQAIVGPVNIAGFPSQGKINLETLQKDADMGFGQVDGLRFQGEREALFVTTRNVLKLYIAGEPKPTADLPAPDLAVLSADAKFNAEVFAQDSTVTSYVNLPVKSADGTSFAEAFLGITAQDTGPFVPTTVFVLASKGDRIFLVRAATATKLPQIAKCRKASDYPGCYGAEVKGLPVFASLQQQAQSIVDRLQK